MSNIRAITGSTRIMNRDSGGGSKLQGIASSTNLNTWAHVAFRNRNINCPCNRDVIFCMNQIGGIGAGGIPGRSYTFAPTADNVNKKNGNCMKKWVKGEYIPYVSNNELILFQSFMNEIYNYFKSNYDLTLVLVGDKESFNSDLKNIIGDNTVYLNENSYNISELTDIFAHLNGEDYDNLLIRDFNKESNMFIDLSIVINKDIQKKINFVNYLLPSIIPQLYEANIVKKFGNHTLGLISTNYTVKITNPFEIQGDTIKFLQFLDYGIYQVNDLLKQNNYSKYLLANTIYIFANGSLDPNDISPTGPTGPEGHTGHAAEGMGPEGNAGHAAEGMGPTGPEGNAGHAAEGIGLTGPTGPEGHAGHAAEGVG